jgi:hypothetical protein
MLFPFKLRIYDLHEERESDGWLRFDFVFDLKDHHITCYREYILFDVSNTPTKCTQIFFNDGESVYGCYSLDKFTEIYEGEYAQKYAEMITVKLQMEGSLHEEKKPGPLKWLWLKLW